MNHLFNNLFQKNGSTLHPVFLREDQDKELGEVIDFSGN